MVVDLIRSLSGAIVYPDAGNFATNRKLWDLYAEDWDPQSDWVRSMSARTDGREAPEEKGGSGAGARQRFVGEEWSCDSEVEEVVRDFIMPTVTASSEVVEVGCGGGRLAARVAPAVGALHCVDISEKMLERAREALRGAANVTFQLLREPGLACVDRAGRYDTVYCFDVMVHMDLHLIHSYLRDFYRVVKPGGHVFLSAADVTSEEGYARFAKQKAYTVGGFYFVCPEIVRSLAARCGFEIVREAPKGTRNTYYRRDYLVLLRRPLGPNGGEAGPAALAHRK